MAKLLPEALSVPSSEGRPGSGRGSTAKFFLSFFFVIQCLGDGFEL
jgi:hypothetical protein